MERSKGQRRGQCFRVGLGYWRWLLVHIKRKKKAGVGVDHHSLPSRISNTPLPGKTLSPYTFFIHAVCSGPKRLRNFSLMASREAGWPFFFDGISSGTKLANGTPRLVISTFSPA